MSLTLPSCASPPDIPQWFDAIHRMPVHTVTVQGHRLAYLDVGEGPPVILIHGYGGSLWQWEYQQDALATAHRVVTLDLLGAGFSDKPDLDYTPTVLLESFRGFMDALKIPRASLIGNSMGAGLVIGMALTYPERVDRIVLIGGLPDHIREKVTSPMIRRALDRHPPTWLARLANRLLGRHFTKTVLNEMIYDSRLLTPAVVERSYRNRQRSNLIKPLLSLANNLSLWEEGFARRLEELSGRPILIIWGEQDKVFPPSVARELQTAWPTARLELVPDAGHIPMWEQPSLVNPLLLRFLQP